MCSACHAPVVCCCRCCSSSYYDDDGDDEYFYDTARAHCNICNYYGDDDDIADPAESSSLGVPPPPFPGTPDRTSCNLLDPAYSKNARNLKVWTE